MLNSNERECNRKKEKKQKDREKKVINTISGEVYKCDKRGGKRGDSRFCWRENEEY